MMTSSNSEMVLGMIGYWARPHFLSRFINLWSAVCIYINQTSMILGREMQGVHSLRAYSIIIIIIIIIITTTSIIIIIIIIIIAMMRIEQSSISQSQQIVPLDSHIMNPQVLMDSGPKWPVAKSFALIFLNQGPFSQGGRFGPVKFFE